MTDRNETGAADAPGSHHPPADLLLRQVICGAKIAIRLAVGYQRADSQT